MEPLDLILVGCGLMGGRHLRGYGALEQARPGSLRLRGLCDPRPEAAERLAAEAETLLGYRPQIYRSAEEAVEEEGRIDAADVVTDPRSHPALVISLLEAGVHVQVEKPLSVTVGPGQAMVQAARRTGHVLAVAENYRRDPMARLLRHAVDSGAIGRPYFASELHIQAGQRVVVSPWRHAWSQGGLALDVGVHYADMLEYLVGPVRTVYAQTQKVCDTREWTAPGGESRSVPVECDDLYSALLTFESGVQGSWTMHFGSAGERSWKRAIYGTGGTVEGSPDRSGRPVRLQRAGDTLEGDPLLAELPEFRLAGVESLLFGERPASYAMEFPAIDRNLIAIETADFLDAVRECREPEVTGEAGLRSVALVMALLESARSGSPVQMEEVLSGAIHGFQDWLEQQKVVSG